MLRFGDTHREDHEIIRSVIEETSASKAFRDFLGSEYYMWQFPKDTEERKITDFVLDCYYAKQNERSGNPDTAEIAEALEEFVLKQENGPKWVRNLWTINAHPKHEHFEQRLYEDVWRIITNFRYRETMRLVFPTLEDEIPPMDEGED